MALKNERIKARRLYIEEGKTIDEIAKLLPAASVQSLYRWCAEEKWDEQREEISTTSFSALKQSLLLADKKLKEMVVSGIIDSAAIDGISKLAKFIERLDKDVNAYGNILLMMDEFTSFLAERDSETLEKIQPLLIEFGAAMSKKYGKKR